MRTPIAAAEFADLMEPLGPWPQARRIAVAVSGGADSLCLAYLAAGWGVACALIVDHGLRPESAAEAAQAAQRLAGFGVPARILRLNLPHGPALAARARTARYAALTRAMDEAGLTDLLLGHHAGDQAETLLMRRRSASGPDGLAAMPAIAHRYGIRLIRPLLGVAPVRLRATLVQARIRWAEDPSNTNPAALRTRLRAGLRDGREVTSLVQQARAAGQERASADLRRATILAERATLCPEGYALLTPGAIAPDCLAALVRMIGGNRYPPAARAVHRHAAGQSGTLGGVRLLPAGRLGSGMMLVREAACIGPPVPASDGALWDSRFRLTAPVALPPGTTIGALGAAAARFRHLSALPAVILQTLPTLRNGDRISAVPHLDYFTGWTNNHLKLTLTPPEPAVGGIWVGDAEAARCHHVIL